MNIDVSQFHLVFFEESFDGPGLMEAGLPGMREGRQDGEIINTFFRATHSVKAGAGTFGLSQISTFSHGLETLLDQMRHEKHDLIRVVDAVTDPHKGHSDEVRKPRDVGHVVSTNL